MWQPPATANDKPLKPDDPTVAGILPPAAGPNDTLTHRAADADATEAAAEIEADETFEAGVGAETPWGLSFRPSLAVK